MQTDLGHFGFMPPRKRLTAKTNSSRPVQRATIGMRITALIDARNEDRAPGQRKLTHSALSKDIGASDSLIRNLLRNEKAGKTPKIMPQHLMKLAEFFDVKPGWLLNGDEDMDRMPDERGGRQAISTAAPYRARVTTGMPVIAVRAGAGGGGVVEETFIEDGKLIYAADAVRGEIVLPDFVRSSFTSAPVNQIHWVEVNGDSMEPTLRPGDFVAANSLDNHVGQGGLFVLLDENDTIVVKRLSLERAEGGGTMILIASDNPREKSRSVRPDEIGVIGRVVGRITRTG